jgi:predicted nucleic acid-binding protein
MIRIFMDSSALVAAVLSPTGAARELIRLSVNEEIQLVISEDVVVETRRNVGRKAPESLPILDRLLAAIDFELAPSPEKKAVWIAEEYVAKKDAFIVAAAIIANVDFLATFDRKHLIDPPAVSSKSGLIIDTPGNILNQTRGSID